LESALAAVAARQLRAHASRRALLATLVPLNALAAIALAAARIRCAIEDGAES
jgi:hypothetical protein